MVQDFIGKHVWDAVALQPYLIGLTAFLIFVFGAILAGKATRLIALAKEQNDLLHETLLALRMRKP